MWACEIKMGITIFYLTFHNKIVYSNKGDITYCDKYRYHEFLKRILN